MFGLMTAPRLLIEVWFCRMDRGICRTYIMVLKHLLFILVNNRIDC